VVPQGFEAYARIDHGASSGDTISVLPAELLPRLVKFLGALTKTPERTYFAIWEDYGWSNVHLAASRSDSSGRWWRRAPADPFADVSGSLEESREALDAELSSLPMIPAAQRRYRVLSGPLDAVLHMHDPIAVWAPLMPELWWPADQGWFVGSDSELAATYVAGRWEMVDILLEGWPDRTSQVEWSDPIR
jgi:hypothetical protein